MSVHDVGDFIELDVFIIVLRETASPARQRLLLLVLLLLLLPVLHLVLL